MRNMMISTLLFVVLCHSYISTVARSAVAKMEAHECPIDGQVFQKCKTCPATCDIPLVPCPRICWPGCGCPSGQVIDTINNRCVHLKQCPTKCPIDGQVFQECKTCTATCDNPLVLCPRICWPGCGCPSGQVIDTTNNRCVPLKQCPIKQCPIEGQVYQECKTCPATCDNPFIPCPRVCQRGCGCPFGQVIDTTNYRCVHPKWCPRA